MKFRVCDPEFVPGTTAHGVQVDAPSHLLNRIEFDASLLMTNSHTFVPSVAPNNPPLTAFADAGFIPWFAPNVGGAGDNAAHVLFPALYEAPATAVPAALFR